MDLELLYDVFIKSSGISTDTRNLSEGNLFFALHGDKFNGNNFVDKALEIGASFVVVDDPKIKLDRAILVKDTLRALQDLATYHRKQLNITIIALTGSNGKTTTKELIREVLSKKYKVHATRGNLNNHIGVPLTLLELNKDHELAVIEMGANHITEINRLCEITLPNWGFVTNFGKAHLEGFGGLNGVIKGKSELYQHLIHHQQNILINGDDAIQIKQTNSYKTTSFGLDKHHLIQIIPIEKFDEGLQLNYKNQIFNSSLYGEYNLLNISAAIAFGILFNVPINKIQNAIESYDLTNNRSQKIIIKNTLFILDAYNANPSSMKAAITAFSKISNSKSAIILGDMKELGSSETKEHVKLLKFCLNIHEGKIYTIGKIFQDVKNTNQRIKKFKNNHSFTAHIKVETLHFDKVLIKGSRSMKLENLIPFFKTN